VTAQPHRHGQLRPGKPECAPLRSKKEGRRRPRERGRPARMLFRYVPLSFPALWHPPTRLVGTAWARPKRSPLAVAGRAARKKWPRRCQVLCGRDARAPGLHSLTSSQQWRSVGLCIASWFVFNNDRQFLARMICTAGQGWHLLEEIPGKPIRGSSSFLDPPFDFFATQVI